ncbi:MAG: hypothetical protein COB77_03025 [Gammaproteobacteria bacterium]|nr:MAG: hypothetical protein COB77_03025 [Gammaproteobacteria bacterium]
MPVINNPTNSLDACNPALNATVSASAGSGKTWLLITRIVRLLIDGAEPGNIIALTFTRKAAAEMQLRLNQRLYQLATVDDAELNDVLQLIGNNTDEQSLTIARGLYEKLMHSLYPIRIQTFHSFCQDILSRFPLEADIAPGFELMEDSSLLERQAWQTLFDDADKDNKLNDALDFIMQVCNGPDSTHTALHNFLLHRSDWWAYTAHQTNAVKFASNELTKTLKIDVNLRPISTFFNKKISQDLQVFSNLLLEVNNKTSHKHAASINDALHQILDNNGDENACFALIKSAFIKKDGDILSQGRKHTAALEKKLGTENIERFIALHLAIANDVQNVIEQLKRSLTLAINKAWYRAGSHYIAIFQRLKKEMRLLDFTDLEWKCYQLLQHADNAHWVQYKIDQRIDHLLIDEFQDTNPTQWHLLSPILEEIAANPEQRPRSVFLVGDEKQSIYSFRRANPALQAQASKWLAENLDAKSTPLDFSRRSSSAIIHCVNHIFEQTHIKDIMPGYTTHNTYLDTLPGYVQLHDLFEEDESDNKEEKVIDEPVHFRNPLEHAREISLITLRHNEADYIAQQILQIVNTPTLITDDDGIRPAKFGDILILMRNRLHVDIYQHALKQLGIPFIGSKKGGLLDNLEIQDLSCLLNTLVTPYNNLALAQVLKSPIFNASDEDLILLAQTKQIDSKNITHWYERLLLLSDSTDSKLSKPLRRAAHLLKRWQTFAEKLPVHDCLDKIFHEGDIIHRYAYANKDENKQKVTANCQRFLELSLETDSGRYPSITRFLQQLNHLKNHSMNPPEEPLANSNNSRVRLMTIHGSKGLEAPIVFLADCNSTSNNNNAYTSLVRWPANESRPINFQLQLSKENTDQVTRDLQQEKLNEQKREDLNLLYVALTRAREQLFISAVANKTNSNNSWYHIIAEGLDSITNHEVAIDGKNCKVYRHLCYQQKTVIKTKEKITKTTVKADPRLLKPIKNSPITPYMIAPSISSKSLPSNQTQRTTQDYTQEIAKWRGTIIHRVLEQLCLDKTWPATTQTIKNIHQLLAADTCLNNPEFNAYLDDSVDEAISTFNNKKLTAIFNPGEKIQTFNEMPLMYQQGKQAVYGIVDRVIKSEEKIIIIDYKSHQIDKSESILASAQQYCEQLNYYRCGIRKLWPEQDVETGILFTHHKKIIWLN